MFEDSLLDARIKTKRGRSAVVSFALQILIICTMLVVPLFVTQELPKAELMTMLVAPPPPPPPPPPAAAHVVKVVKVQTDIEDGKLKTPTKIPDKIVKIVEDTPPPTVAVSGVVGGVPGGVPGGTPGGVIGSVISNIPVPVPKLAPPPAVIRVSSGVEQGMLIRKIAPSYPPLARQARVQGTVTLEAMIGKDGTIEDLKIVSGHPMLAGSAVEAVKQWKYKPYLLNGSPVEVQTEIMVIYSLGVA